MSKPNFERNKDKRFEFFPGQRRQVMLEGITAQCNSRPGSAPKKKTRAVTQAKMNGFTLEGMKIEFFSHEDSKKRLAGLDNRTLYDFVIEREGQGEGYLTLLRFKYRSQETTAAYGFWVKHGFNNIWADFIPTANAVKEGDDNQMTLSEREEEEEAETSGA